MTTEYRMLEPWEPVEKGDEYQWGGEWDTATNWQNRPPMQMAGAKYRRPLHKLPACVPQWKHPDAPGCPVHVLWAESPSTVRTVAQVAAEAKLKALKPKIEPGTGYRLLGDDEIVEKGDSWNNGNSCWSLATGSMEITDLYHITGVVFPELENIKHGAFHTHFHKDQAAKVTMQSQTDGSSFTMPISMSSLSLLSSHRNTALEAQAAKDAKSIKMLETVNGVQKHLVDQKAQEIRDLYESLETKTKEIKLKEGVIEAKNAMLAELRAEIGSLKSSLAATTFAVESWQKHSDKQVAEVKRLEAVCHDHWYAKCDTEKKWAAEASEHDNTKNQLKEVRVANGKLLDTKHELEKHARGMETLVASQGKANSCQASKIQALESQLNLLKHQYESKCQAVRDLRTAGLSKERDEYSKALGHKDTQIAQITKQAGEWKQTAATRAKEMERLAELVLERTKERDALQAEKGLCPCKPSKKLDPRGQEFWAEYPLPLYSPGFHYAGMAPKQTVAETLSLNTRVTAVEARMTKLEEAEGFPMESCQAQEGQDIMAYMAGKWVKARKSGNKYYSIRTPEFNKEREWDLANQPTRWKPMSK